MGRRALHSSRNSFEKMCAEPLDDGHLGGVAFGKRCGGETPIRGPTFAPVRGRRSRVGRKRPRRSRRGKHGPLPKIIEAIDRVRWCPGMLERVLPKDALAPVALRRDTCGGEPGPGLHLLGDVMVAGPHDVASASDGVNIKKEASVAYALRAS